jgi:hypothetical protein
MSDQSDSSQSKSVFSDVDNRIFPLFADINKLQEFVDNYLNHERYEHGFYFRVSMPMVFMELLDYGSMGSRSTGKATASQQELLFMIPLDWFEECDSGDQVFDGRPYKSHSTPQAVVTPFIFVDNPLSVMVGRDMFGWPKSLIAVQPEKDMWMPGPGSDNQSVKIGAMRFPELFRGEKKEFQITMEINRRSGISAGTGSLPLNLFGIASQWWGAWAQNYSDILVQWKQLLSLDLKASAMAQQMRDFYQLMMSGGGVTGPLPSGMFDHWSNSIGLKQFRCSDEPKDASYMAIANSRSQVTAIRGMGMLGNIESLMTSMDGGFSIRIHRFPAYPLVEKLGLVVAHTETTPDNRPVDVLKPCLPFWINMDFNFQGINPLATLVHGEPVPDNLPEEDLPDYRLERSMVPPMSQEFAT